MLLETVNTPFSKALLNGNSSQATFLTLPTIGFTTPKAVYGDLPGADSTVIDFGAFGAAFTQNRVQLIPYADGPQGSVFKFRLYGWDKLVQGDENKRLWIPFLLAEFQCTTSNVTGIDGYPIRSTERLCDTMVLTSGSVGTNGFAGGLVSSPGTGTNLIAYALVNISGCMYAQFDFQKTTNVTMNCLWSRA